MHVKSLELFLELFKSISDNHGMNTEIAIRALIQLPCSY